MANNNALINYGNLSTYHNNIVDVINNHTNDTDIHFTTNDKDKLNNIEEQTIVNNNTLGYEVQNFIKLSVSDRTYNGVTATINEDSSITLNGQNTANKAFLLYYNLQTGLINEQFINNKKWIPTGEYIVSLEGATVGVSLQTLITTEPNVESTPINCNVNTGEISINITDEHKYVWNRLFISNGASFDNVTIYPMIRLAVNSNTTYKQGKLNVDTRFYIIEEYSEETQSASLNNKITLGYTCKNMLNNNLESQTINGITATINDDKSITINGTATNNADFDIIVDNPKTGSYILSGCPDGGDESTYYLCVYYTTSSDNSYKLVGTDYGQGAYYTINSNANKLIIRLRVINGQTISNLTFYPMVRDIRIIDSDYTPYLPTVDDRLLQLEHDTGWVDCISNATTDGFAFDESYTQAAKIRKIGKYVSFRGTFKVISNGNDAYVRGFVRGVIPSGYRPSEAILAQCSCYTYTSSTSANYQAFTAQITTDGAIAVFVNNGGTLADIYGKTIRVNMDWLIG